MENMGINKYFWRDKPVFLTGHTGFKGGWTSLWLQSLGASVAVYALEPAKFPCLFDEARIGNGMRSFIADVRDADRLLKAMEEFSPEIAIDTMRGFMESPCR